MSKVEKCGDNTYTLTLSAKQLIALHALVARCHSAIDEFYDIYCAIDAELEKKSGFIGNFSCRNSIEGRSWDGEGIKINNKLFHSEIEQGVERFI